jgi:hypothetical protein
MFAFRELERLESRVLAALRFVDAANGLGVDTPLRLVASPATEIVRNRSDLYVVRRHPALAAYSEAFLEPPAQPEVGSVNLRLDVHDPSGLYLARALTLPLPRDARPENALAESSLFRPVPVELYRSPAASLGANWAALRVSLREAASGDALGGALLRVSSNGRTLARGLSDWRGEASGPVVGVPITTWSDVEEAVFVTEIEATLQVYFDTGAGSLRTPAARLQAGRPPAQPPMPDPAALEGNAAALRGNVPIRLAAGRPRFLALNLDLPG